MSIVMKKLSKKGYSRLEKEAPEDIIYRRAQFLIYKAMKQADSIRKPSFVRIRFCRLKIKIGKKLKKSMSSFNIVFAAARVRIYRRIVNQLKLVFCSNNGDFAIATLPSVIA